MIDTDEVQCIECQSQMALINTMYTLVYCSRVESICMVNWKTIQYTHCFHNKQLGLTSIPKYRLLMSRDHLSPCSRKKLTQRWSRMGTNWPPSLASTCIVSERLLPNIPPPYGCVCGEGVVRVYNVHVAIMQLMGHSLNFSFEKSKSEPL